MQHLLSAGKLLDEHGHLCEAGYATSLVKEYDRRDIRAAAHRIKEWDYYLVYNNDFGVALTIDDNSYMGLLSASFAYIRFYAFPFHICYGRYKGILQGRRVLIRRISR